MKNKTNVGLWDIKKIYKNPMSMVLIGLVLLRVGITFYFNNQTSKVISFESTIAKEIKNYKLGIAVLEKEIRSGSFSDQQKAMRRNDIKLSQKLLKRDLSIQKYLASKKWSQAYALRLKTIDMDKKLNQNETTDPTRKPLENAIERERLRFLALKKRNVQKYNEDFSANGTGFFLWTWQNIIPVLLTLVSVYIAVNLFGESYRSRINVSLLIPQLELVINMWHIGITWIVSSVLLLMTSLLTLSTGTIVNGFGSLNYPVLFYELPTMSMKFNDLYQILLPSFCLQAISSLFILVFVMLICSIAKNKMASLFISLISTIGLFLLTSTVDPLKKIGELLPTTYLQSVSVTTGATAYSLNNPRITFSMGIIMCSLALVVLIVLISLISYFRRIRTARNQNSIESPLY